MNLLFFPVLIHLLAGALLIVLPKSARGIVAVISALLNLLASILIFQRSTQGEILVLQMANWPAPWGISLVADALSGILLLLSAIIGLLTVLFSRSSLEHPHRWAQSSELNRAREDLGFHALLQFLMMGVNMSFLTGDLFNLFVAFEVMLISSYGLMLLGNETAQLRQGFKYVVINLVASAIFVTAAGLSYGLFGTLNMADIAQKVALHGPDARITLIAMMLCLVFATKSAVFPLGFWLPNAYPTPTSAASAFFAALLTKVGAYTLVRTLSLMFPMEESVRTIILALSSLTMIFGGLGAIARHRWRYALAFANVASVGYLVMGFMLGSSEGYAASIYYLINSVIVIFSLFLVAALAELLAGEDYHAEGHLRFYPWLGVAFFIGALALAGIPPTSGFIGKYALVSALFQQPSTLNIMVAVTSIITGFLLLYATMKIWRGFFWGESDAVHRITLPAGMSGIVSLSVLLIITLTLGSAYAYRVATMAAKQMSNPESYIQTVLAHP
jgi:multicomponent Na+:H+ antiporter subunit D